MTLSKNLISSVHHLYNEGFSIIEISKMLKRSIIVIVFIMILN